MKANAGYRLVSDGARWGWYFRVVHIVYSIVYSIERAFLSSPPLSHSGLPELEGEDLPALPLRCVSKLFFC